MSTNESTASRFARVLWSLLAVAALVAVGSGLVYLNRGGATASEPPSSGTAQPGTADTGADAAPVGSETALAAISGTFYYIKAGEETSELWSWKPGQAPKSEYKSKNRLIATASVSPDGRYLAFLVPAEYPKNNLVVRDLKNKTERTVAKGLVQGGEVCMDAVWAPDGRPMILTQTRIDSAGGRILRWFDIEANTKSQEIPVEGCFVRPVPRGDDGYDLYYMGFIDEDYTRDVVKQFGGTVTPTGLGPAVEEALGEPLLGLGSMSESAGRACITIGQPSGPDSRVLSCKVVMDVKTKTVVYAPDGGFKGPVLFLNGGQSLGRFSGYVSLMAADGTPLARADEPTSVKTMAMLTYVP
ncbi:hypothetical protein [Phytomonospora endophytica]|uniref:WD40 repeat protein n=1 Tax=Phytomonospora endophytica TaxID=714109 RepID=A0A841FV36_9ACTN|nr:hypothetical protein [Phytomonospora endophytica]MBB6036369.1 hypothetical protein [Phytomonospora endophytica]GIG65690.1 hypothetical protein Pen01_19850 [Phytomonospora endophytica]